MGVTLEKKILAIITSNKEKVGGGAPIFVARDADELTSISFILEKILDGIAHKIDEETMIIVRHAG
ncbi:capping complex subunit for YIEGIA [Mechercharimyces sp. CAU 1602]|uniref:capping complex subunit for YIEGIA n=1 Tax=Mechercharimyces sp. CAU 1602 TaxID=2973933 RepID=UPI002161F438|nr:hypothetical protein [Mechercharimyces sp. CAU 1602]MCS1350966.1 hypothetical protein [Mechercharimyces sp. CAU 1602]